VRLLATRLQINELANLTLSNALRLASCAGETIVVTWPPAATCCTPAVMTTAATAPADLMTACKQAQTAVLGILNISKL
jgi:hypothetical protein